MPDSPEVAVIMPTRALAMRAPLIRRALMSVLSQEGVTATPIVIVNGPDGDPTLIRELEADSRVRLSRVKAPGIPGALRAGRALVNTEWFSALDDDDIYLPGALATRIKALRTSPSCETVVTNGLRRNTDEDEIHIADIAAVEQDPLNALTRGNWLLPGAWLCRSASVGEWLFDEMPQSLECTYLAIQFALRGRLCFVEQPTIAWYTNTPDSESKSDSYIFGQEAALERILEMQLPNELRQQMRRRITGVRHRIAELYLREDRLARSLRWHLRSLAGRGGWRYASFSLKLLRATLWR